MLESNYYKKIEPYLFKYFETQDAVNLWLFCPNYLWGYFSPISLIISGDKRPLNWIKQRLELKK